MAQTWTRWAGWCLTTLMVVAAMGFFFARTIHFTRFVDSVEAMVLGDDLVLASEGPEPGDREAVWHPSGNGRFPLLPIREGLVGTLSRKQVMGLAMRASQDEEGVAPRFLVEGVEVGPVEWMSMETSGDDARYRFGITYLADGGVGDFFVEAMP